MKWLDFRSCPVNPGVITLNPMDNNPYQSPRGNPSSQPELRDCDRDQCPTCLHRQKIWKAINVVGRYCCPKCSAPLVVRLGKRHRLMSLAVALAIGIPAIVMFFFVNKTNMTFVSTYSTCSTFYWSRWVHFTFHGDLAILSESE